MEHLFHVCVLGGDARHLRVIEELANNNVTVYPIGFDKLPSSQERIIRTDLEQCPFEKIDAILLPISGTNENGKIQTSYTEASFYLTEEILHRTPEHCTIFTGAANVFLQDIIEKTNRKMIRLFADDHAAIINSIPTAEGTLQIAMEETNRVIHGTEILVLGYGRVAKTVSHLFSVVGAKVCVAARSNADLARAKQLGMQAILISELPDTIAESQIIINTIPKQILDEQLLSLLNEDTLIIDIASAPGGTDFDFAKKQGIRAFHALGLPGKVAPITSGDQITKLILQWMKNEHGELE